MKLKLETVAKLKRPVSAKIRKPLNKLVNKVGKLAVAGAFKKFPKG